VFCLKHLIPFASSAIIFVSVSEPNIAEAPGEFQSSRSAPWYFYCSPLFALSHTGANLISGCQQQRAFLAFTHRIRISVALSISTRAFIAKKDKGNNRGMNLSACARMTIVSDNRVEWRTRQPLIWWKMYRARRRYPGSVFFQGAAQKTNENKNPSCTNEVRKMGLNLM
jgi:hypothetical protein